MVDPQSHLESLRAEIDTLPAEYRVLVRYLDARLDAQEQSTQDLRQAFETGKGALVAIKWVAGLAAALAAIWAGFHGSISVK